MPALEARQIVDEGLRQRHDLCPQLLDVANPAGTDPLDPFLSPFRVTELAGAVVMAGFSRDLLRLHVPTRPDRAQRLVVGVDHDGMPRLIRRTIVEVGGKRLRIRTRVARSYGHPDPLTSSAIVTQAA